MTMVMPTMVMVSCSLIYFDPNDRRAEKLTASHGHIPLTLFMVRTLFGVPLKQRGGEGLWRDRGR